MRGTLLTDCAQLTRITVRDDKRLWELGLEARFDLVETECLIHETPKSNRKALAFGPSPALVVGETEAMLVLSRKKNEKIVINDNVVITVVDIRGDKVRLGIQAPREVPIHRSEVHAAIQHEQEAEAAEQPPKVSPAEA